MIVDYKNLSVNLSTDTGELSILRAEDDGRLHELISGRILLTDAEGDAVAFSDFPTGDIPVFPEKTLPTQGHKTVTFKDHPRGYSAQITIVCTADSVAVRCVSSALTATLSGSVSGRRLIPVRTRRDRLNLCSAASGMAFTALDDGIFDIEKDRLIRFDDREKWEISFDFRRGCPVFSVPLSPSALFVLRDHVLENEFAAPYHPIDRSHPFETPPVGWMTWYAVKFDACEKVVLHNARRLKELFGKYDDRLVIWIDWEWCHRGYSGNEDTDNFSPRADAYPHGLAYMAEKITEMGMIPALWCAPAQDARKNRMMEEHPDWVLGKWRELWYVDPTHPDIAGKYIPEVFRQFVSWGYKALKWDFLYHFRYAIEDLHNEKHDPSVPLAAALRAMTRAAADTVGKEIYMLFCGVGGDDHNLDYMDGSFHAARIGGDVFNWKEFTSNVCRLLLRYYPFHNTSFYADGDNIVLREEFNNRAQVRSRVSLYGLTGLPVTIGDRIDELDEFRIDCLRRIMPVVTMTPRCLEPKKLKRGGLMLHVSFLRSFGSWEVVGMMNPGRKPLHTSLDLRNDLGLTAGKFAVYDYWRGKFVGLVDREVKFTTGPLDTDVLRITAVADDAPTVIGSSRHITQGGYEFESVVLSAESLLIGVKCVGKEKESVTLFIPESVRVCRVTASAPAEHRLTGRVMRVDLIPEENRTVELRIDFERLPRGEAPVSGGTDSGE